MDDLRPIDTCGKCTLDYGGLAGFLQTGFNMYTSYHGNDATDNTHAEKLDAMLKFS